MNAKDFNLSQFNNTLAAGTADQELNYCSAITMEPRKISVTLKYDPAYYCSEYAVLGPDLKPRFSTNFSSYYYGCSPKTKPPKLDRNQQQKSPLTTSVRGILCIRTEAASRRTRRSRQPSPH